MRDYLSRLPSLKWWVTNLATLPASLAVGVAGYFHQIALGIALAAGWVSIVALVNWPERFNRRALEEALAAVPAFLGIAEGVHVRCAIYVPVAGPREDWLLCVTSYMPERTAHAGYRLPASKGIVGLAYRFGETRVEILDHPTYDDQTVFQRYMMHQYGFTQVEAQELRPDRRAYLASPIVTPGNVVLGVIYLRPGHNSQARNAPALPALSPGTTAGRVEHGTTKRGAAVGG